MEKNKKSPLNLPSAKLFLLLAGILGSEMLMAQQSLETLYRLGGEAVTGAFEPQREVIQKCSAVIYNKRDEIAYGVVISKDGYILTKASEILGKDGLNVASLKDYKMPAADESGKEVADVVKLSVRIDKELYEETRIIAIDEKWDVALMKVDAQDLTPAEYAPDSKLEQGSWIVVNGVTNRTKRRVLVGIISANAREIPVAGGAGLGVILENVKDKLQIKEVSEGSGAKAAGVEAGDVIVALDGKKVSKFEEIAEALKDKKVGEEVKLTVKRKDKEMDIMVKLSARGEMVNQPDRNDQMSGDFSKRRSGFPRVIQHDVLGNSDTMGGPVLDMKGRLVGMNIARANRCETFAIPVEELQEIAKRMLEEAAK